MVGTSWESVLPQKGVFFTFGEEVRKTGRCTPEHDLIYVLP
jgi:hypothetical protein